MIGSSIAREADNVFYTLAGPEISVATTKAYSTQLIAIIHWQFSLPKLERYRLQKNSTGYIEELKTIPDKIQQNH